jgi:hypothetical protein
LLIYGHLGVEIHGLVVFLMIYMYTSGCLPGPPSPSNDSTKYMCGTCDNTVTWEHRGIVCGTCDQWYHINCQNIHSKSYDLLNDRMVNWCCLICENPNSGATHVLGTIITWTWVTLDIMALC